MRDAVLGGVRCLTERHPEIGREVTYPGAPILFHRSPMRIQRRAPLLGEHTVEVLREAGLDEEHIARLVKDGGAAARAR